MERNSTARHGPANTTAGESLVIRPVVSRRLLRTGTLAHLAAAVLVTQTSLAWGLQLLVIVVLALHYLYWRRHPPGVMPLRLHTDGRLYAGFGAGEWRVLRVRRIFLATWLVSIEATSDPGGESLRLCLLADSLPRRDYQRLQRHLRNNGPFTASADKR